MIPRRMPGHFPVVVSENSQMQSPAFWEGQDQTRLRGSTESGPSGDETFSSTDAGYYV